MTQNIKSIVVDTVFGPLTLEADDHHLRSVQFTAQHAAQKKTHSKPSSPVLEQAVQQLEQYFSGRRQRFELPYVCSGTEFQEKVWRAIAAISFGSQRTYGDVAADLGNVNLARAVGQAAGRNPLLIVIPCHRLVGSGGQLGGFAAGIGLKKTLLEHERGIDRLDA